MYGEAVRRFIRVMGVKEGEVQDVADVIGEKYNDVFHSENSQGKRQVVNILTNYNDCRKMFEDLSERLLGFGKPLVVYNRITVLEDIIQPRYLIKMGRRSGLVGNDMMMAVVQFLDVILCIISICQIFFNLFSRQVSNPVYGMVSILVSVSLFFVLFFLVQAHGKKQLMQIKDKLKNASDGYVYEIFDDKLGLSGNRCQDDTVYLVENLSRLDPLVRVYLTYYLKKSEFTIQLWVAFDYIYDNEQIRFRNSKLRREYRDNYQDYYLEPLKEEEKQALYYKYRLQNEISREYINSIGIDILFDRCLDIDDDADKAQSFRFIENKIKDISKVLDRDYHLLRGFYCLVYMSAKYNYSFSLEDMSRLLQQTGQGGKIIAELEKESRRIILHKEFADDEVKRYLQKMILTLKYYCIKTRVKDGARENETYHFAYEILGCLQSSFEIAMPTGDEVKMWALLKLISHEHVFQSNEYFFDLCNLLAVVKTEPPEIYRILAIRVLGSLNRNRCWEYYSPILENMRSFNIKNEAELGIVKEAVINNLVYLSDGTSMNLHRLFLGKYSEGTVIQSVGRTFDIVDLDEDDKRRYYSQMVGCGDLGQYYYEALYAVFSVCKSGDFFKYTDSGSFSLKIRKEISSVGCMGLIHLIWCLVELITGSLTLDRLHLYESEIKKGQKGISQRKTMEGNVYNEIISNMLLWVRQELKSRKSGSGEEFNRVYMGILVENSCSNMLKFIYNLCMNKNYPDMLDLDNQLLELIRLNMYFSHHNYYNHGITDYIHAWISGNYQIQLKLARLTTVLLSGAPDISIIVAYLSDKREELKEFLISEFDAAHTKKNVEEYFVSLVILFGKLKDTLLQKEVCDYLYFSNGVGGFKDSSLLRRYMDVLIYRQWNGGGTAGIHRSILEEINNYESANFAILMFERYAEKCEGLLEQVPRIKRETIQKATVSSCCRIVLLYMANHGFYDCDEWIRNYCLVMGNMYPGGDIQIIESFLTIIDRYAADNHEYKGNNMHIYNRLLEDLIHLQAIRLKEMALMKDYPWLTLQFNTYLIKKLAVVGCRQRFYTPSNKSALDLLHKCEADDGRLWQFVVENFQQYPAVCEGALCMEYVIILTYTVRHQKIYSELTGKYGLDGVVQIQNALELVDLLLKLSKEDDSAYLWKVKETLLESGVIRKK